MINCHHMTTHPCLNKTIGPVMALTGSELCCDELHSENPEGLDDDELNGDTIFFTSFDPLEPILTLFTIALNSQLN